MWRLALRWHVLAMAMATRLTVMAMAMATQRTRTAMATRPTLTAMPTQRINMATMAVTVLGFMHVELPDKSRSIVPVGTDVLTSEPEDAGQPSGRRAGEGERQSMGERRCRTARTRIDNYRCSAVTFFRFRRSSTARVVSLRNTTPSAFSVASIVAKPGCVLGPEMSSIWLTVKR